MARAPEPVSAKQRSADRDSSALHCWRFPLARWLNPDIVHSTLRLPNPAKDSQPAQLRSFGTTDQSLVSTAAFGRERSFWSGDRPAASLTEMSMKILYSGQSWGEPPAWQSWLEGVRGSCEAVKALVRIPEERRQVCEESKCLLQVQENGGWTRMWSNWLSPSTKWLFWVGWTSLWWSFLGQRGRPMRGGCGRWGSTFLSSIPSSLPA